MSSGTQLEMDWAGLDSAPGGAGVSPVTPANDATSTRYRSDEEILGIDPATSDGSRDSSVILSEARPPDGQAKNLSGGFADGTENPQRDSSGANRPQNDTRVDRAHGEPSESAMNASPGEMPAWMAAAAGDPRHSAEAQALWREHQEFRAAFRSPEEARAVKELLPGGLRDALSLREATQSIERIDAALFSGDARAQAEVVAEIARANPAAFRALFAEAAKVLAGSGTETRETRGKEAGNFHSSSPVILSEAKNLSDGFGREENPRRDSSGQNRPQNDTAVERAGNRMAGSNESGLQPASNLQNATSHQSPATSHSFDPAAYAAFERATNDAVARDVRGSIHEALARVLPDGVAEGAARRIGEDIFHEVHRALAADRALSEQVAGVLRERRFGAAEQQRVAALLAGRARQMVPGVARRVIGEWTSTVLSTARTKAARQAAAAARVDIASPGGSLDSTPMRSRAAGSREVDYAGMSDEQILGI